MQGRKRAMSLFTRSPAKTTYRNTEELVRVEAHGLLWTVRPQWAWVLEGPQSPDWSHLRAEPTAELVKRNEAREVWRVEVAGQPVYAKLYRAVGWRQRIRALLQGRPHLAEWRTAEYARLRGFPAIEPIAHGSAPGPFGPWALVTLAIGDAVPLDAYWREISCPPRAERDQASANAVIRLTAQLIARAHQEGFRHEDLHAANLMVQRPPADSTEPIRVLFVDLQKGRINKPVSRRGVLRNLAQLNQWFRRHTTRTERLRFAAEYVRHRQQVQASASFGRDLGLTAGGLLLAADREWRHHARRLWAKRDRRIRRDGRYFARVDLGSGWRGHVFLRTKHAVPGSRASQLVFARDQWKQWLAEPLNWVDPRQTKRVKQSRRTTVCRGELPVADGPLPVMIKRVLPRRWKRLLTIWRDSRNLRTWRKGYALLNRNLPTARPLAVLQRRRWGLLQDSLLITEKLPGAMDLAKALGPLADGGRPNGQWHYKHLLTRRLVRLLKQMHECGFYHRDLKASNILVVPCRNGDGPEPWLIDLDGLFHRPFVSRRRQLLCLVRLSVSLEGRAAVTRTDRLRFLQAFLRSPGQPSSDWKLVWRRLARAADRKRSRKQRQANNGKAGTYPSP
jgi:tRNA A-37 threonylcarbamoyl transferase component Bud32